VTMHIRVDPKRCVTVPGCAMERSARRSGVFRRSMVGTFYNFGPTPIRIDTYADLRRVRIRL
jgi:hypothetical protein